MVAVKPVLHSLLKIYWHLLTATLLLDELAILDATELLDLTLELEDETIELEDETGELLDLELEFSDEATELLDTGLELAELLARLLEVPTIP